MQTQELLSVTPTDEYRPTFLCIAFMFVSKFVLAIAVYMIANPVFKMHESPVQAIVFGSLLSIAIVISYTSRARLVFGPEGIECRENGRTVAQWSDVMMIGPDPFKKYWDTPVGIILRQSQYQGDDLLAIFPPRSRPIGFIPLARFDRNWENGPIGDALRQYAPSLFTDTAVSALPSAIEPSR